MAESINRFTFTASVNNTGTLIALVAHKDDDEGRRTEVFTFTTAEANNLCELIRSNCKTAKDRRKAVKKGEREEEKCPPTPVTTATAPAAPAPSKSAESSASTPKKKVESSIRRSGTGVAPVGRSRTDDGGTPRPIVSASKPWTSHSFAPRQIMNSIDNWVCEVRCSNPEGDVEDFVKKVVKVLNDAVPLSEGRYKSYSYTEMEDTLAGVHFAFVWTNEHPDFPGIYPLVGMLNTLDERDRGCSV